MDGIKIKRRSKYSRGTSISPREYRADLVGVIRQLWTMKDPARRECIKDSTVKVYKTKKDGTTSKLYNVHWLCAECDRQLERDDVEVDHIIPVGNTPNWPPAPAYDRAASAWGVWLRRLHTTRDNLQILCGPCNKAKGMRDE